MEVEQPVKKEDCRSNKKGKGKKVSRRKGEEDQGDLAHEENKVLPTTLIFLFLFLFLKILGFVMLFVDVDLFCLTTIKFPYYFCLIYVDL